MQQRLASLLDPPAAFAHRGARAHAPENTLAAFELALKLGANGLESDVWLTRDGIAVLDHDGIVKVGLRKRPIREFRRDELPPHIPTLTELFAHCGSDYHLSLDVKDEAAGPVVVADVQAHAPDLLPRLWLCQTTWQSLVPLRGLSSEVKLVESIASGAKLGPFLVAVGYPQSRRTVHDLATGLGAVAADAIVHPDASVGCTARFEIGVVVMGQTWISPGTGFGCHTHVGYGATVGHDTQLGAFCSVMPGACIGGDVQIGEGVLVGANATVLQGLTIGDGAVIGAGAVVTRDVEPGSTVVGVPARATEAR